MKECPIIIFLTYLFQLIVSMLSTQSVAPQKVDTGMQENDLMLYLCVADSLLSSVLRA